LLSVTWTSKRFCSGFCWSACLSVSSGYLVWCYLGLQTSAVMQQLWMNRVEWIIERWICVSSAVFAYLVAVLLLLYIVRYSWCIGFFQVPVVLLGTDKVFSSGWAVIDEKNPL
jgi:hypothetical protein